MKGTVTATIKRKNGAIEKYEQENTVFDIPALMIKRAFDYPETLMAHPIYLQSVHPIFSTFGLSEYEADTTKPTFTPEALITSSSSSHWSVGAQVTTTNDKDYYKTATWYVEEPLTLKSIFFKGSTPSDFRAFNINGTSTTYYPYLIDNRYYNHLNEYRAMKFDFKNYKFTNSSTYRYFFPSSPVYENVYNYYKLANENERFGIVNADNVLLSRYQMSSDTDYLAIFSHPDETLLRKFNRTQFTDLTTLASSYERIVNTGTKNYLVRFHGGSSSITSYSAWEIPNEPIDEAQSIAPTVYNATLGFTITTLSMVVGNCIMAYNGCYVMSDDASIVKTKGYYNYSPIAANNYATYVSKDQISVYSPLELYSTKASYRYFNPTAMNFEKPLEVAAGDVLTIMYKISIA